MPPAMLPPAHELTETQEQTMSLIDRLHRHVEALTVDIGPRAPLLGDSLPRAENYVRGVFEDAGLQVRELPYDYRGKRVVNLVASAPGTIDATSYYVVGAHYDTVPTTPGADDNASAVAVLLELARRHADSSLDVPVHFVAFTMEEPPAFMTRHQGSRVYVRNRKSQGDRIAGAIVLEMVGYTAPRQNYPSVLKWAGYPDHGRFIGIVGNWRSRRFGNAVIRGFTQNEQKLPYEKLFVPLNGWVLPATRLSDHSSFWDKGIASVMITDTAFFRNPNYHQPSDTIDTLDFGYMAELVESLDLALAELPPPAR